jgi:hypothetical protein
MPLQVDLIWTPPAGWVHSAVDRWYEWDKGIRSDELGSCASCSAEAAARWDAAMISMYDTVYLTRIRYVLTAPQVDYRLRVYQGTPGSFDTLLNFHLEDSLVYYIFDTLNLNPILLDPSKDLWIGYWVNDLGLGFPLPLGNWPAIDGYGNMLKLGNGPWSTLFAETYGDFNYNWSIGGYLETPNDTIIYPLFNIYRAIDNQPFEKINEASFLDTIYYDNVHDLDAAHIYYYVTCVYPDGESVPSDILDVSFVNVPERKESAFKVFPNPATDKVSIESIKGKINSISLIDSYGRLVMEKIVGDERIDFDISHLNNSIYIIKIITDEGMFSSKLIIER